MSQSTFGLGGSEGVKEENPRRGSRITVVVLAVIVVLAILIASGKIKLSELFS